LGADLALALGTDTAPASMEFRGLDDMDRVSLQSVGLPAHRFIQDDLVPGTA